MKHIPTPLLPALALLTLGSCATTNGLTTTEPDGVYYSSKDRTTEVATASTATMSSDSDYATADDPDAVANPDYQDGRSRTRGSASNEYYDDDFDYSYWARQRRYTGLGMSYGLSYATPYWYNPSFSYYDPLLYTPYSYSPYGYGYGYDPFWGPSWYGSSISVNIGWGLGGWGPWGPSYGYGYRPWGYGGYNRGYWDGYYSGLYGGYNNYYGGGYWDGYRGGNRNVSYRVARRTDRSVEVVGSNRNGGAGRQRVEEATGGRAAGATAAPATRYSRGRVMDVSTPGGGRMQAEQQQAVSESATPAPGRGRLYRIVDSNAGTTETGGVRPVTGSEAQPQKGESAEGYGRRRFYNDQQPNLSPSSENQPAAGQPTRTRRERYSDNSGSESQPYQQPTRRERSYEAPTPTRSYEQPTRSYEQPTRSYNGGGNSGGGNSGGGGGGGRNSGGGGRGRVE
jgi:hypothetical protein